MRITLEKNEAGALCFSLPRQEELEKAEKQIIEHCRNVICEKDSKRLNYELKQMKKSKTAFHFLILKEIQSLSQEQGYPLYLRGNIAGSIIAYLLDISPINPRESSCSSELIWESYKEFYIPDFEISISKKIRPLIQKRLDEKFGFAKANDTLFHRITIVDTELCDEVKSVNIDIRKFDTEICTEVLKKIYSTPKRVSCNFEQLINFYAYNVGSFSNEISFEELLDENVIVTRDKLYFSLILNNVPKVLAIKVVKNAISIHKSKKREYLLQLEKYSLPEKIVNSIKNATYLWNSASCISRLCMICQNEYDKKHNIKR